MAAGNLVHKLATCGAIKAVGNGHELRFTLPFEKWVIRHAGLNRDNITVLQGWRAMLAGFHASLMWLSDEDLATLVTLLEFQTKATRAKVA